MGLLDRFKEITGIGRTDHDLEAEAEGRGVPRSSPKDAPEPRSFSPFQMVQVVPRKQEEMVRQSEIDSVGKMLDELDRDPGKGAKTFDLAPGILSSLGVGVVRSPSMEGVLRDIDRNLRYPYQEGNPLDGAESLARLPQTKDMQEVTSALQTRFAKAPAEEVMQVLGRADGKETDDAPPPPGDKRDRWIAERVALAFDPKHDFMTHPSHMQTGDLRGQVEFMVGKTVLHEADSGRNIHARASGDRAFQSSAITDFMQDGRRLDERVVSERQHLEHQPDEIVQRRFALTPLASMEPMPAEGGKRGPWIEDALRSEHAAARAGLMAPEAVHIAAMANRGQVPYDPDARMPRIDWGASRAQQAIASKEAQQVERLPDVGLRSRYSQVPGIKVAQIPPVGGNERREWIEIAVQAQRIREAMPHRGVNPGKAVEKDVIVTVPKGPEFSRETALQMGAPDGKASPVVGDASRSNPGVSRPKLAQRMPMGIQNDHGRSGAGY